MITTEFVGDEASANDTPGHESEQFSNSGTGDDEEDADENRDGAVGEDRDNADYEPSGEPRHEVDNEVEEGFQAKMATATTRRTTEALFMRQSMKPIGQQVLALVATRKPTRQLMMKMGMTKARQVEVMTWWTTMATTTTSTTTKTFVGPATPERSTRTRVAAPLMTRRMLSSRSLLWKAISEKLSSAPWTATTVTATTVMATYLPLRVRDHANTATAKRNGSIAYGYNLHMLYLSPRML
eukprot:6196943-Pleurochrysis_carterae.AAC.3